MESNFIFDLGQEVKDRITGFTGIIMARTQFLSGCNQYSLQSKTLDQNDKPMDWVKFNEEEIVLVEPNGNKIGFGT